MGVAGVDSARISQKADHHAAEVVTQRGSFRGADLKLAPMRPDAQSMLKDAAEEMTFKAADELSKKRPLNERNVRVKPVVRGLSDAERMANAQEEMGHVGQEKAAKELAKKDRTTRKKAQPGTEEHLKALREKTPDLTERQLEALKKKILEKPPGDIESFKEMMEKEYPDVTLRYVALMYLRKALSDAIAQYSNSDVQELIQQTRNLSKVLTWTNMFAVDLFKDEGAALRAGLNISEALVEFAHKRLKDSSGKLRSFYREAVLGYDKKLSALYKKLLKRYGTKEFRQVLRFLDRSISCDMSSEGPSIDKEKLLDMLDDTFVLRTMANTHKDIAVLLRKTKYNVRRRLSAAENEAGERDVHGTMMTVIEFIEKGFYSKRQNPELLKLLDNLDLNKKNIALQIVFLNGISKVLREMPLKVFPDQKKRLDMMQSVQATLDHLVGIELEG